MIRTGLGVDTHKFAENRRLILGGVSIDHPLGLEGHSDADVLAHAITDALLGAAADGDIGRHYPDSDPAWKDADSLRLMAGVRDRLFGRGVRAINNVDATIIAEAPRVAPYVDAMRANIARALRIPVERVSIKATTAEGMGALGRREGMAAMAVATLEMAS